MWVELFFQNVTLKSKPQVPVNATLFGSQVKLRCGPAGSRWTLSPMTGVFIRRGRFGDAETHKEEVGHVMTAAETGALPYKPRRAKGSSGRRKLAKIFPCSLKVGMALLPP